jgi:hypothetical protein
MATWLGMALPTAQLLLNGISTTSYAQFAFDRTHRAQPGTNLLSNGDNISQEPLSVSNHAPLPATVKMASPGDQIFERIHVFPQVKKYPFILSTQLVDVEVWNAFRETAQQVSAVTISGPAGVSIVTPYVLPIVFPPFVSKLYTVKIDVAGAAQAANTIQWDFDGLSEPLFTITGLRLLPFTISPDWSDGIDDVQAWLTDVMVAYDDTEQRMQIRQVPNRAFGYTAKALEDREAGLLLNLVYAWQGRAYGVLLWMDASPLRSNVVAGNQLLDVDTTNMGVAFGDTVIVIADAFTWFASPVTTVTPDSLQLDTPLDQDFFAGTTMVIPIKMGRMAAQVPVEKPTNAAASTKIKFDLQVVTP